MFKDDFPLIQNTNTIYLDTAASAQKPSCVLETMDTFYQTCYANVHRGQCEIATKATASYENARQTVADFLGIENESIVFTKGTTESINLVANGYGTFLKPEDEILVSIAEHHANFVPWQQICKRTGAKFKIFNVKSDGSWDMDDFKAKLSDRTKLVAVNQLSNVLGIVNPISDVIALSHQKGAKVLIDGAQGVAHIPTNLSKLDCDYYVFSGHKIYGPTGIGVLYGKKDALECIPPYQFGGDMVKTVRIDDTVFADIPARFEGGTPPFVEAIGLAEAIRYVSEIGMNEIESHEKELTKILMDELSKISNVEIIGDNPEKQGVISFNVKGIHPADIAFVLSKENICVRVGHHCAMPIHHYFGKDISLRVSLGIYNDEQDIEFFIQSLKKSLMLLGEG